jgi:hypothetical protein
LGSCFTGCFAIFGSFLKIRPKVWPRLGAGGSESNENERLGKARSSFWPKLSNKAKKIREKKKNPKKAEKCQKLQKCAKRSKTGQTMQVPTPTPLSTSLPHGTSGNLKLTSFEKFQTTPNADKISQNSEDAGLVPNPTLMN